MRFGPDTIGVRTLLVLIVGLTVSHLLSLALFVSDRDSAIRLTGGEHAAERIATITRMVEGAPEADRPRIVRLADGPEQRVTRSERSALAEGGGDWRADVLRRALSAHFGGSTDRLVRLRVVDDGFAGVRDDGLSQLLPAADRGETMSVSLELKDRSWLNFVVPIEAPGSFWSLRTGLSMVVMLLAIIALSALVMRRMTEPLRRFARMAERLGTDVRAPPMPARGPAEVRQAIRAFNLMQDRIRSFVEDRTQMLAAISHDLGTPITRLRLRAELVEDDEQRGKMLADLTEMETMVAAALAFARDDTAGEPRSTVDLRSLVQRVCDDLTDGRHDVTLEVGGKPVRYGCRPAALRRALTNLVHNAAKYGHRARVSVLDGASAVTIRIDDDGPGIPEALQEEAFRPFRRLEGSRNRDTGGTGLGLAVARSMVRAHGGGIGLSNREEGGLRVEVTLPRT